MENSASRVVVMVSLLLLPVVGFPEHEQSPLSQVRKLRETAPASDNRDENPCRGPGIHHLSRPHYPERPDGPEFDDVYLHFRKAQPGSPTVLILPGGPGLDSIDSATESATVFPKNFGLVFIDPRGVGCNRSENKNYPLDFYSTKNLALDALAVAKDLKLANYFLYGESYGTMVATVAAGLAEKGEWRRPSGIVLDGTLGRAFRPMETFIAYAPAWKQVRDRLPQAIRKQFSNESPPLGLAPEQWGKWIAQQLTFRPTLPKGGWEPGFEPLKALRPDASLEERDALKKAILGEIESLSPPKDASDRKSYQASLRMYQAIACREIAGEAHMDIETNFRLEKGELVASPSDLCKGIAMDRPFDAADWKTTVPIYYFQGAKDPSTPAFQARHSVEVETAARRTVIKVPEGAHSSFHVSLNDCTEAVWKSIGDGGNDLRDALRGCEFPTTLETLP